MRHNMHHSNAYLISDAPTTSNAPDHLLSNTHLTRDTHLAASDAHLLSLPVVPPYLKVAAVMCATLIIHFGLSTYLFGSSITAKEADTLRGDVPSAATVRSQLVSLSETRDALMEVNQRLQLERGKAQQIIANLSDSEQRLANGIEDLRESTRHIAMNAFVRDGSALDAKYILDASSTSDVKWRQHLIDTTLQVTTEHEKQLLKYLESQAEEELFNIARQLDSLNLRIQTITLQQQAIDKLEDELRDLLHVAIAWDRAEEAITDSKYGFAPLEKWEKMRFCESSDNYQAVSPSGRYTGAYQFDRPTWQSVGGTGNPGDASPSEQDARARELYARRGDVPWPVCGSHLR